MALLAVHFDVVRAFADGIGDRLIEIELRPQLIEVGDL